jgi:hypothetical protein
MPCPHSPSGAIYRPFFLGAIATVLTAGASWGILLLWQIGIAHSFTSVSIQQINAHGQAQIYGWVGLFVLGFAYQAFPRFWRTRLVAPRLAKAVFVLMVSGIVVRSCGMMLNGVGNVAVIPAVAGNVLELLAVVTFVIQMATTYRHRGTKREPYDGFIFASLAFFVVQAGLDCWHTYATMTAPSLDRLLWHVATFQAPLRDLQIHGMALLIILGVCLRMLPVLFGLPEVPRRRARWSLGTLVTAVIAEVGLFIGYRLTGQHWLAALLMIPWLMLAVGCWGVAVPWKLWRAIPVRDRSTKFIRVAFAWLAVSLLLLLLLPAYLSVSGMPFSHAYYGAIRHAITVGFVSLMIMGVASRFVARVNGHDPARLPALWQPFILLNLGCVLRVSFQISTDWFLPVFNLLGTSGILELTALSWWGIHLIRLMYARKTCVGGVQAKSRPSLMPIPGVMSLLVSRHRRTEPQIGEFPIVAPQGQRDNLDIWVQLSINTGEAGKIRSLP